MQINRFAAASMLSLTPAASLKSAATAAKAPALTDGAVVMPTPTPPKLPGDNTQPTAIVTLEYLVLATYLALALLAE